MIIPERFTFSSGDGSPGYALKDAGSRDLCSILYHSSGQCISVKIRLNPLIPNSQSKTIFSFQFIASNVWYSREKLAGGLLFGLVC